jgi:hypothetical protein
VVVVVWYLVLQLFVQLVSINTTVVIRTPFMAKCTLDTTLCDKVVLLRLGEQIIKIATKAI